MRAYLEPESPHDRNEHDALDRRPAVLLIMFIITIVQVMRKGGLRAAAGRMDDINPVRNG